jgi:hypothetical protein
MTDRYTLHRMDIDTMKSPHANREYPDTIFVQRRCSGPCDQGRHVCETPEACEVPEFVAKDAAVFWRLYAAIVLVLACLGVAWLLGS